MSGHSPEASVAIPVADIEAALDELLRTAIADDAAHSATRPVVFEVLTLEDLMRVAEMSRAEADAVAIIKRPVGRACRMAIRCLGKELFRRLRTVDAMGDVVERVCDMDPAHWGYRASIIDHAWDGIGQGAETWLA